MLLVTITLMGTPVGRERGGVGVGVWILCLAPAILLVAAWSCPVAAHHPGGKFEPLVLIDGRKDGYRAVLEVYPPDPLAGSLTQFMFWVTPDRWGCRHDGPAHSGWIRPAGGS